MDLNLLLVLDAVAEAGSVSMAASRLNLSQPAVSHALNRLRQVTGDRLFVRSGSRLVPTPRADDMRDSASEVIRTARSLLSPATFIPETGTRAFRIGTTDYSGMTIVPGLMTQLRKEAPNSSVSAMQVGSSTLEMLEKGGIDISFWADENPGDPFLSSVLFSETLVGIARHGHPLFNQARGKDISLESYIALPHAIIQFGTSATNPVDTALASRGLRRDIRFTGQGFAVNLAAIRQTDLIMSIPSRLLPIAATLGFESFNLPIALPGYTYRMIWHKRTHDDPACMWLRQLILRVAGSR